MPDNRRTAYRAGLLIWIAFPAWTQIHLPIRGPAQGPPIINNLSASNVISEYFDTPSSSAAWTISSDSQGPALSWYTNAQALGFHWENYGHGMAWQPWLVGAGSFDLKFDHTFLAGSLKQLGYQSAIPQTIGAYVAISTDPPGAQSQDTFSIVAAVSQAGPIFSVRRGVLFYLQSTVTCSGANGVNVTVNNGDRMPPSAAGTYVFINGLGPFQIQSVTSPTSLVLASGSPSLTSLNHVTLGADVELSNLSGNGQSIQWPLGAPLKTNPPFTFEVSRNQNVITFALFTPAFMNGTVPWGVTPGASQLVNGNAYTLVGGAAAANFKYLIVSNLNSDHLTSGSTGWTGGPTSASAPPPAALYQGVISNIRGYGVMSSGFIPTVSSVLPSVGTTFRTGSTATISGTGFQPGGSIRIGVGSTSRSIVPVFLSPSTLLAVLPDEADGTYPLKYIAPNGIEAPSVSGIVYSAPTVTRIDPHEASPSGNETVVFTGSGFDPNTTVSICGVTAAATVIDAFHLQVTTPPCAAGIPTIVLSGSGGVFFTSNSSSPKISFGYANHPYMNFDAAGLQALNSKWADPHFADYTAQLERNVSISAALSGVTGTFQVGDAVTQPGGVTGTAFGYQYGMLVIFPVSGVFGPGAISGPNGAGTITMVFSIPRMLQSLTAPLAGVNGSFNIGDSVTQGAASGQVYTYDGKTIGIVPSYGSSFVKGSLISGPTGAGTPSAIAMNSPNDVGTDALSGWAINTWEDYGWYDVLSGTSTYSNQFYNGTPDLNGSNGILSELNRIDFTDHFNQSFDLERSAHVAMLYDAMWPSLSQSQKTTFLNYLDAVHSYCNTLETNADVFIVPTTATFNNWISIGNTGCIQVGLALMNSVYTVAHGSTSELAKYATNLKNASTGYISREMAPDGVILEGSLYTAFGLDAYIWAGRTCLRALGNDNCGAGGTGLLSMPNFLQHYQQTNLTFAGDGQWFTFDDTQPSLFGEAFLADEGDRFNQPNLLYVADDFAHRIATGNAFTGQLNSQASGWDVATPAFLWRTATPAAFSGWPTTDVGTSSNLAVIRSDTSYTPNFVIGFKGQAGDAAFQGHSHFDPGSFVMQDRGQAMFIDPGYNQPNAPQHSTPAVDGVAPSKGSSSLIAKIDAATVIDTATEKSMTMIVTPTYPNGVSRARRTLTTYQDKAFVILDDLVSTGPGVTAGNFQTGFPTTAGNGSFTISGPSTSLICTPYGPPVSIGVSGPLPFGLSWVFANLGVQWYAVNVNYTSSAANPLTTICIDSSSGLTAKFNNTGVNITVSFSDSTTLTYALGASGWQLQ